MPWSTSSEDEKLHGQVDAVKCKVIPAAATQYCPQPVSTAAISSYLAHDCEQWLLQIWRWCWSPARTCWGKRWTQLRAWGRSGSAQTGYQMFIIYISLDIFREPVLAQPNCNIVHWQWYQFDQWQYRNDMQWQHCQTWWWHHLWVSGDGIIPCVPRSWGATVAPP